MKIKSNDTVYKY